MRSNKRDELEAERLKIIHDQQQAFAKQLRREVKVKKAGGHLPGEEAYKRDMAIMLKLSNPRASYLDIALQLGETKSEVKKWFNEPETKEKYLYYTQHLKLTVNSFLETLGLEAALTLAVLMRFGSEKYMFDSASGILDRMGIARVSKQEIDTESTRKHEWTDRDKLLADIRELPEEQQEQVVEALEKFEELLVGKAVVDADDAVVGAEEDGDWEEADED